jgi:acetoin utilization protein AcuB
MRLVDIMTRDVQAVGPKDSVEAAWTQMRMFKTHHLVVLDAGQVVGILSDRDLGSSRGEVLRSGELVGDVMSQKPLVAGPTMTLRQAANLLRGHTIGSLPVMDRGKLVGIVTISDLLTALGTAHERPVQRGKRWVMARRGPRKHQAR